MPGFKRMGGGETGWQVYRLESDTLNTGDAEWRKHRAKQKETEEREREEARRYAGRFWANLLEEGPGWAGRSLIDHPRVHAYLADRGIDVSLLPPWPLARGATCRVPPCVRFHPRCAMLVHGEDGKPALDANGKKVYSATPAMVGAVTAWTQDGRSRRVVAVQRIYLRDDGPGRIAGDHAKKQIGSIGGGACRLTGEDATGGVLILCEGIETGLAIVAGMREGGKAMGAGATAAVWSCVVGDGLKAIKLLPSELAAHGGWIRRVIVAGDHDSFKTRKNQLHRPGARYARQASEVLRCAHPSLRLEIALPSKRVFEEAGVEPLTLCTLAPLASETDPTEDIVGGGKSVDWLDVLVKAGAAAVRRGILELGEVITEGTAGAQSSAVAAAGSVRGGDGGSGGVGVAGGDGGAREIIPDDAVVIARTWLDRHARAPGSRRFRLARWAGGWWWHEHGRYATLDDELLCSVLWGWLHDGFAKTQRRARTADLQVDFVPTDKTMARVMLALRIDTFVRAESMPAWLPAVISKEGKPMWSTAARLDSRAAEEAGVGRPRVEDLLVYRNGALDLAALLATREVRMLPHSADLFNAAAFPYDLPVEALQKMLDGADEDDVIQPLAPAWIRGVTEAWPDDPRGPACLQEMMGYTMAVDRGMEKVFAVQGPPRSFKGCTQLGLEAVVGKENVAALRPKDFEDRASLYTLLGKRAAVMGDAHISSRMDATDFLETLKMISGQDAMTFRDVYSPAVSNVRAGCQLWMFMNPIPSQLRDNSTALARRFVWLPVSESFEGREDEGIKRAIPGEGAGIAVWALMGLLRLRAMARPRIEMTRRGRAIAGEFEAVTAPMVGWRDECLLVGPEHEGEIGELYHSYTKHCEAGGAEPVGLNRFRLELMAAVPTLQDGPQRRTGDGRRARTYLGVALKPTLGDLSGAGQAAAGAGVYPT